MEQGRRVFAKTYSKQGIYRPWRKDNFDAILSIGAPILEQDTTSSPLSKLSSSPTKSSKETNEFIKRSKGGERFVKRNERNFLPKQLGVIGVGMQTKMMADSLRKESTTSSVTDTDCFQTSLSELDTVTIMYGSTDFDSETGTDSQTATSFTSTLKEHDEGSYSDIEIMRDAPATLTSDAEHSNIHKKMSKLKLSRKSGKSSAKENKSKDSIRESTKGPRKSIFSLSDEDIDSLPLPRRLSKSNTLPLKIHGRKLSNVIHTPKKHNIKKTEIPTSVKKRGSKKVSFPSVNLEQGPDVSSIAKDSGHPSGILKKREGCHVLQPLTSTPQPKDNSRRRQSSRAKFMQLSFDVSDVPLPSYNDEDLINISSFNKIATATTKSSKPLTSTPKEAIQLTSHEIHEVSNPPKHSTPKNSTTPKPSTHSSLSTPQNQLKRRSPQSSIPSKPSKKRLLDDTEQQTFRFSFSSKTKPKELQYSDIGVGPSSHSETMHSQHTVTTHSQHTGNTHSQHTGNTHSQHSVNTHSQHTVNTHSQHTVNTKNQSSVASKSSKVHSKHDSTNMKLPEISQGSIPTCVITLLEGESPGTTINKMIIKPVDMNDLRKYPQDILETLPDSLFI